MDERTRRWRATWRRNRKKKGICTECRRKVVPHYTQCLWHLEKRRAKQGTTAWIPGGKGRPPTGIQATIDKAKKQNKKALSNRLLRIAAEEGLGKADAPAFLRYYRKKLKASRGKGKLSELMQNPSYEDLMALAGESIKVLDEIVQDPAILYSNTQEVRHETVGADEGVPGPAVEDGGDPW